MCGQSAYLVVEFVDLLFMRFRLLPGFAFTTKQLRHTLERDLLPLFNCVG